MKGKRNARKTKIPMKKAKIRRAKPMAKLKKATPKPLKKKPLRKEKKEEFEERSVTKTPKKPTEEDRQKVEKVAIILADSSVRQMLIELGGENALAIIRNFYGNHSDEDMAKKLKLKISDVRATLNKLHNEGLVNYIREKDSETGWYSYSWSLNLQRIERWANTQAGKLGMFRNGGGDYYFCTSCGTSTITDFESAANDDFRCERCNKLLEFIDEKKMLELYEKRK